MALVKTLTHLPVKGSSTHTEVTCTYAVVTTEDGAKHLQLDTYGSDSRQLLGKKSQSIRLSQEAVSALKKIIAEHGL
jgi:hypothetical protein